MNVTIVNPEFKYTETRKGRKEACSVILEPKLNPITGWRREKSINYSGGLMQKFIPIKNVNGFRRHSVISKRKIYVPH